jgi:hypothetical protein
MLGRIRRWVHSMLKSFDIGLYSVLGLICSGGQVPFKSSGAMLLPLLVKVKIATFIFFRCPFFIVTVLLQFLVTDILNVIKELLVTTKNN